MSGHSHEHSLISVKTSLIIGGFLLFMTWVTVAVAGVDLGVFNFAVAMLIATFKASLVVLFFMGLKYDGAENRVIFATSFVFCAIFMVLTSTDVFFRGDVKVKGPLYMAQKGVAKFKKPWIKKPEMVTQGKAVFTEQCASCHGDAGKGDGIAAGALNPKPRDFTADAGWKNGRKPSQVFKTLTKGLGGMPAFGNLSTDDRWSVAHYILGMGGQPPRDTLADLKAAGVDPSGKTAVAKSIPIDLAIELMATGK